MKKITFLLFFLLFSLLSIGQVSSYIFSQSTGTYTSITGGVNNASTASTPIDDNSYSTLPIGFAFSYNNVAFTTFGINANGWITMGSATATSSVSPLNNGSINNIISSFGVDLIARQHYVINRTSGSAVLTVTSGNLDNLSIGSTLSGTGITTGSTVLSKTSNTITISANATSTGSGSQLRAFGSNYGIRYETIGVSPNRSLVVQFSGFSRYSTTTTNGDLINFQIILNESSNSINFIYNIAAPSSTGTINPQVGLRGNSSADFNNRSSTTSWSSTIAGNVNDATITFNNLISPATGLTYTFSPPVITTPPNCASNFVPINAAISVLRNTTLSWTAPASPNPSSYDLYFGTTTNPPLLVNQIGTTYTFATPLNANTQYFWKVVPKNAIGDAVGCIENTFTTGNDFLYCSPTYSNGPGTSDGITNVTLGTLNNTSTQNNVSPYYTYFNNVSIPNLTQGLNPTVSITFGSDANQFSAVWIDYNQNGTFEASEGIVSTTTAGANGTSILTLTVPTNAVLGNTRMRIRGGNDSILTTSQACGVSSSGFGETEDYIVNITLQPTDLPDYVNLQFPATATIDAGNSTTIFAQVYEAGLTDVDPNIVGQAPGIEAWIGISPVGQNTNPNTWTTFIPATWNSGSVSNNDEYQANIGANLPAGTYYYASRFRLNGGAFVYGGTDGTNGNFWDGTTFNSGVLTVNPTQCATIISPTAGATNVVINGNFITLSYQAPTSGPAPTAYDIYFSTTSGNNSILGTTSATSVNITNLAYNTTYYWKVVPKSTLGGTAVGCLENSFTTEIDPMLGYCASRPTSNDGSGITNVTLGSTNFPTLDVTYAYHGSATVALNAGVSNNCQITFATGFTYDTNIWIDKNNDQVFDSSELVFQGVSSSASPTTLNASFVLPGNFLSGNYKMRIGTADAGQAVPNPCYNGTFGVTLDFPISVIGLCPSTATWNGTTWSTTPSTSTALVFDGDYSGTGLVGCSAKVNAGRTVTITSGTLDLQNYVDVIATGVLNIESGANLLQANVASVNFGSSNIKQNSAPMVKLDYTAWSSPVVAQKLKAFSPETLNIRFYTYNPATNAYVVVANPVTTDFAVGRGYLIRSSDISSPTVAVAHNGIFTGVPVNGTKTTAVTPGFNLVGNPYPSKIDALNFLANATNTGLGITTLHFWTHTVAAVGGIYPANNYASFNSMGGTAAAAGGSVPNGTISVGQGFFVNPTTAGNVTFLNTMRSTTASTQFFKSASVVNLPADKHRFWLNLTTPTTANNQILIGYTADASNDFDAKYDATLFGNSASVIYSKVADKKLAIQGRTSFATTDVLPLGLNATEASQFTISLADFDGLFVNQNIYLRDNVLNTIQDLKVGSYTFNAAQGELDTRFEVVFENAVLSTNSTAFTDSSVIIIKNNNGISIETGINTMQSVSVFDIRGRLLQTKNNVNASAITLPNVATANQVLIVKITNTNNQTVTKKVVN